MICSSDMGAGLDENLQDQLDRFLSNREIYKVHCDRNEWPDWKSNNIAVFPEGSPDEGLDFSSEIDVGDVLIAQYYNGGTPYTFGIGVVSSSLPSDYGVQTPDFEAPDKSPAESTRIDVNWTVVADNGEHIQQGGPDEFPAEKIAHVSREFFDELLAGFDSGSYPPPGTDLVQGLFQSSKLHYIEDMIEAHLPIGEEVSGSINEQIKTVVRWFFTETDGDASTKVRREEAFARSPYGLGTEQEDLEADIVSSLWKKDVDDEEDPLSKYFDPALERMKDVWNAEEPWETSYSTPGDADLFLMPVNDRWIPEFKRTVDQRFEVVGSSVPEALSGLDEVRIWGTRGGERNADTFESLSEDDVVLYYRNGAIIARGRKKKISGVYLTPMSSMNLSTEPRRSQKLSPNSISQSGSKRVSRVTMNTSS